MSYIALIPASPAEGRRLAGDGIWWWFGVEKFIMNRMKRQHNNQLRCPESGELRGICRCFGLRLLNMPSYWITAVEKREESSQRRRLVILFIALFFLFVHSIDVLAQTPSILTLYAGGGGSPGIGDGGPADSGTLLQPMHVAFDNAGNGFIADEFSHRVRKVNAMGIISTAAGTGTIGPLGDGGPATAASLNSPYCVAIDSTGNLYIADRNSCRIRKVNTTGIISTVAGNGSCTNSGNGGPATAASIAYPEGIAVDRAGNLYIANGATIRKVDAMGVIDCFAGTTPGFSGDGGQATAARLDRTTRIAIDKHGNVYIADGGNRRIRKVDTVGIISTFAGNGGSGYSGDGGPATAASFAGAYDVGVDSSGNVYITSNRRIRKIDTSGIINAIAGNTVPASDGYGCDPLLAVLIRPLSVAVDGQGDIYITDMGAGRIKKVIRDALPVFTGGANQSLALCSGTVAVPINSLLSVRDSNAGQTATWSVIVGPVHGAVLATDTMTTTGDTITPSGQYYMPAIGYTGNDSFKVRIADCSNGYDTTTIHITIGAAPTSFGIAGTRRVCVGGNITLTDTTLGGVWSSSNMAIATIGSGSGIVTGLAAGTAVISYHVSLSCGSALAVTTITVNPLPSLITGTGSVCSGLTVALADSTSGGVWSSGSPGVATIGSASGVVTGVMAGTSVIAYTIPSGCAALKTVTVNTSPSLIAGGASICLGGTSSLSNAISGGTWSSSVRGVATVGSATGIVSTVTTGITVIAYSLPTGCITTKVITVNSNPPTISGPTGICIGETVLFSHTTAGGTWSSGSTAVATAGSFSGNIIGISAGTATISYTTPIGCIFAKAVTVNPLPAAISGTANLCAAATTMLYDATSGGTWGSGSTSIATIGSGTGVVTGVATGTTLISYTLATGCATTATVTVDTSPTPITTSGTVCLGSSDTLSDTVPGGTWTSSDYTTVYVDAGTGVVTGFGYGAAIITYTLSSGCYANTGVTVNSAPTAILGASAVCVGATANLYNSVTGGVWTSSNPSIATINTSGVYTGVAAGTATISYSTGAGCTVTYAVTVHALPATITGTLNICPTMSTTLSSTTSSGTWTASGSAVTIIGSTGVVTGVSAGTSIISYTTGTSCRTTAIVTVNPLPATISGAGRACPGSSTLLGITTTGGVWSSAVPAIATVGSTSGAVTGVTTGTVTVAYTLPTGCSSTKLVTINPLPAAITGPDNVCVGQSATMATTSTGGAWTRSNTNITIGSASGLVTGVNAGTAIVTYTLPTGCYVTKAMTINSSPGTITGTMQVCAGATSALSVSAGSGVWSSGSTPIATVGSSTGIVSGVAAGTAIITYSVGTGCSATATVTVHALPGAFTVTGGGGYCAGDAGLHVGLSGSATGVNYQLYMGASAVGSPVAGTGGALDFGFQVAMGTYTVVATNAQGCTAPMTGSVAITINPLPAPISGPSAVCVGAGIALTSSGGGTWVSSAPGTATINSTSGIVTGVAIGTTTITYTLPTACAVTKTITVSSSPSAIVGPVTVCAGGTATLTVSPGGGLWSSSAGVVIGSLSGVVTGVTTGAATVTYSLGTGCTVTRTMTVLVSPAAITGSMQLCVGGSSTLSSTTGGGAWSAAPVSIGTISGAGVVTGIAAGAALISYTAGGCSATATVTVNAVPGAISGPGAVCAGATSPALSVTPGGGTWSTTATTLHIGSTDGIVTGVAAGTGVITYSLGTGMTACSVTKTITVNTAPTISGASGVCVSSSTSLTVTPAGSGSWTSGAPGIAGVTSGGVVTGVATGTAAITFTPASGCIAIKTVTVNTTPGAITGTAQVCVGGTTPLSVTSGSGGVWTSGSVSVASVGSLSGIVSGVGAGVSTITYSLGTGCTVTKVVTVNALPPAITGGATICIGSTTVLSNPIPGGAWSSGGAGVASVSAGGLVTGVAVGTAAISYTLPTGCAVAKDVTVNSLPGSISGANHVCAGSSAGLTVTGSGGLWSSSNVLIAGVGSGTGVVTGIVAGTATITYSLGPGCEVTKQMTVNALPAGITGSSSICIGSSATLTTSSSGGTWSSGSTGIATVGASSGIVTGVAGGSATISYTVASTGCAATYGVTVITVPPITGLTNLCAWGDTVTIFNTNPAGSYSSSLVTVTNLGGGMGRLTTFAPGTGSVTYTLAGVGCALTMQVTVNTLPGLITGIMNLCAGSSSTLGNSVGGGVWSSGAMGVATIGPTSGLLTGVGAGSTYIRYTIPNGCKVDTVANVSTFPEAGSIAGAAGLCVGDMSALSVGAGSGGVWTSTSMGIVMVSGTGLVNGIAAGVAAISYTVTNVCGTATATHALTVNPIPDAGVISGVDSLCVGSLSALSSPISGGVWSCSNGNATVSSAGVVSGVTVGMDTVVYTVTSAEGCVGRSEFVVKVKPWGLCGALVVRQAHDDNIVIWPNPAKDELNVENAMGSEVRVYNMLGQEVIAASLISKKEVLNIKSLVPGIYVVEVVGDFGKVSRRLVVGR